MNLSLMDSYANNGMLQGELPLYMAKSRDWSGRVAVSPNLLQTDSRRGGNLYKTRGEMTRFGNKRLLRSRNQHLVLTAYNVCSTVNSKMIFYLLDVMSHS